MNFVRIFKSDTQRSRVVTVKLSPVPNDIVPVEVTMAGVTIAMTEQGARELVAKLQAVLL